MTKLRISFSSIICKKRIVQVDGLTLEKVNEEYHALVLVEHGLLVFYYTVVSVACKTFVIANFEVVFN